MRWARLVTALLIAGSVVVAVRSQSEPNATAPGFRAIGLRLVHAQPYVLDQAYVHTWRKEAPLVTAGWLLVVEADPVHLVRRQHAEPVLYVGEQTAERVNNGDGSGRLVCLVPCNVDATGALTLDLAGAPIWLGSPALPERVGAARIQSELSSARAAGITPPEGAELASALASGGGTLYLPSHDELELVAADLIAFHAPSEVDLVEGLRVR